VDFGCPLTRWGRRSLEIPEKLGVGSVIRRGKKGKVARSPGRSVMAVNPRQGHDKGPSIKGGEEHKSLGGDSFLPEV